jgi:hypothetical protein
MSMKLTIPGAAATSGCQYTVLAKFVLAANFTWVPRMTGAPGHKGSGKVVVGVAVALGIRVSVTPGVGDWPYERTGVAQSKLNVANAAIQEQVRIIPFLSFFTDPAPINDPKNYWIYF